MFVCVCVYSRVGVSCVGRLIIQIKIHHEIRCLILAYLLLSSLQNAPLDIRVRPPSLDSYFRELVVAALAVSASATSRRALLAAEHGAGSRDAGIRIYMAARCAPRQSRTQEHHRIVLRH